MKDVIVRFQPVGVGDASDPYTGMGSFGQTDENGEFTLRFSDDAGYGAIIGDHTVTIDQLTPEEEENDDAGGLRKRRQSPIPPKWANGSQTFTVEEGDNEANFDLSQG